MSKTPFEMNREHIAKAFVEYCMFISGGHPATTVTVDNKTVILGSLTANSILKCLTDCFEVECFKKLGREKAISVLADTYQSLLNKDNSKLTHNGIDFMNQLMSNCVELALKDPKNNTLGLEMY